MLEGHPASVTVYRPYSTEANIYIYIYKTGRPI